MTSGNMANHQPYDRPGYAGGYDAHYNLSAINEPHFRFECRLVEEVLAGMKANSWVDVACGTGLHLRTVTTDRPIERTGLDRSPAMLGEIPGNNPATNTAIRIICGDIRELSSDLLPEGDLVTSFWYGYVHQGSVAEIRRFLERTAGCVTNGGSLLLGICDPVNLLRGMAHEQDLVYGAPLKVEALVWSFEEPWGNDRFDNCIAVHPELILAWLSPLFGCHEWLDYPATGLIGSKRQALLLSNRIT